METNINVDDKYPSRMRGNYKIIINKNKMKYSVGDKVLVEAKIIEVDNDTCPYGVELLDIRRKVWLSDKDIVKAEGKEETNYWYKKLFEEKPDLTDINLKHKNWACTYHRDGSITGGNTKVDYSRSEPKEDKEECKCSCHIYGTVVHSGRCKCGVMPKEDKEEVPMIPDRFRLDGIGTAWSNDLEQKINDLIDCISYLLKKQ